MNGAVVPIDLGPYVFGAQSTADMNNAGEIVFWGSVNGSSRAEDLYVVTADAADALTSTPVYSPISPSGTSTSLPAINEHGDTAIAVHELIPPYRARLRLARRGRIPEDTVLEIDTSELRAGRYIGLNDSGFGSVLVSGLANSTKTLFIGGAQWHQWSPGRHRDGRHERKRHR